MNIAVLMNYDSAFKEVGDITSAVAEKYCRKHGYTFLCHRDRPRLSTAWDRQETGQWHPVWDKILWLIDLCTKGDYDWIFYLDSDAIILNHDVTIESIAENRQEVKTVILSKDVNGINTGAFIVKPVLPVDLMLHFCWGRRHSIPNQTEAEQIALNQYIDSHGDAIIDYAPQSTFNSYLYRHYGYPEDTPGNYKEGHFVLHLPGCSKEFRVKTLSEYAEKVK